MYDLVIKNGKLVLEDKIIFGDIGVSGEKISCIEQNINCDNVKKIIDANGCYVLPGLIDPHVHLKQKFKDTFASDDFYTGTVSAAFGGDTTVMDFAIQWDKEKDLNETTEDRIKDFNKDSIIDYSVHPCPTISSMASVEAMNDLVKKGYPSFKVYMTYSKQNRMADDGILYRMLQKSAEMNGMVGVHAENDAISVFNENLYLSEEKTTPNYFPMVKDNLVEAEAINRAIYINRFAKGNLYIFHCSTKEGAELISQAKARGESVLAETCTHYLVLDSSKYTKENGADYICSPPLREGADSEALWEGINNGTISIVSSDHCGYSTKNKDLGNNDFSKTPNGIPGVEARLPIMYTYGVEAGKIAINKMVEVLALNPAKAFGIYPQKGVLSVGSDADIVILDTETRKKMCPEILHSPVDWTPFDGMEVSGFASCVISRGEVIIQNGALSAKAGRGKNLFRKL